MCLFPGPCCHYCNFSFQLFDECQSVPLDHQLHEERCVCLAPCGTHCPPPTSPAPGAQWVTSKCTYMTEAAQQAPRMESCYRGVPLKPQCMPHNRPVHVCTHTCTLTWTYPCHSHACCQHGCIAHTGALTHTCTPHTGTHAHTQCTHREHQAQQPGSWTWGHTVERSVIWWPWNSCLQTG